MNLIVGINHWVETRRWPHNLLANCQLWRQRWRRWAMSTILMTAAWMGKMEDCLHVPPPYNTCWLSQVCAHEVPHKWSTIILLLSLYWHDNEVVDMQEIRQPTFRRLRKSWGTCWPSWRENATLECWQKIGRRKRRMKSWKWQSAHDFMHCFVSAEALILFYIRPNKILTLDGYLHVNCVYFRPLCRRLEELTRSKTTADRFRSEQELKIRNLE